MSIQRKKCFPKLSRLRKDLWSWHSDVESLMQALDAPKKNALVKDERMEDKMNAKCFEMIHKLCKLSALSPEETIELLKNADPVRPISRYASSGQLSTGRLSPEKNTSRGRAKSSSPGRGRSQEKGTHRYRSPTRRQPPSKCSKASWSRSESPSPEDPCRKHLTFDEDDEYFQKLSKKEKRGQSLISNKNSKKIIKDLEDQIIQLEKANDQLCDDLDRLEQEVQWYKENRDHWIQYSKDNDRKLVANATNGHSNKTDYDQLRKQYAHLQGVYENISQVLNNGGPNAQQHLKQIQSEAARYKAERNNARLQVQDMTDKMNWYKTELQTIRSETGNINKKPKRRYVKKTVVVRPGRVYL